MTVEEITKKRVSKRRNGVIADVFHRVHFVEKWGSGITRILDKEPDTEFKEVGTHFISVFMRKGPEAEKIDEGANEVDTAFGLRTKFRNLLQREGVSEELSEGVRVRLGKELEYIRAHEHTMRSDLEKEFMISTATVERDLSFLKRLGLILFVGPPKTGQYIVTERFEELFKPGIGRQNEVER